MIPHLTDEDPDDPESSGDEGHDNVSCEIQEAVATTTVTHDVNLSERWVGEKEMK